tara:strand:+ start:465 stop:587 length:123 start_codon:yes stop_codon:yes gene_type:complete
MSQQEKPATHCGLFFGFKLDEKRFLPVICTETLRKSVKAL